MFPTRRRTIAVRDEPVAYATSVCIHGGHEHPSRGRLSHDLAYTTHDGAPTGSWHRTPRRDSIIVGQQGCSITGPAPFMARRFTYRVDTHTALRCGNEMRWEFTHAQAIRVATGEQPEARWTPPTIGRA